MQTGQRNEFSLTANWNCEHSVTHFEDSVQHKALANVHVRLPPWGKLTQYYVLVRKVQVALRAYLPGEWFPYAPLGRQSQGQVEDSSRMIRGLAVFGNRKNMAVFGNLKNMRIKTMNEWLYASQPS